MKLFRIPALIAAVALAMAGCATLDQGAAVKGPGSPVEKAKPADTKPVVVTQAELKQFEAKPPVASGQLNIVKPLFKGEIKHGELFKLDQPKDIGWSKSGELYVCDRTGILFFDKKDKFTHRIDFKENWSAPSGCTLDKDGNYLVAFYSEQVVRKIDGSGNVVWTATYPLAGKSTNNPNYVIADPDGAYWITDGVRYQLLKGTLDKDKFKVDMTVGRVSGTYTAQTRVPNDLPGVIKVVRNPYNGYLYALLGPSIKVLDPKTGQQVSEFGGLGLENEKFQQVSDIFFKKDGSYLVLDGMMNTVKEFNKDLGYVATYADDVRPGVSKLSANFSSGFTYDEATRRLFVISGMDDRVYLFEIQK